MDAVELKHYRTQVLNMTQQELATKIGCSISLIRAAEQQRHHRGIPRVLVFAIEALVEIRKLYATMDRVTDADADKRQLADRLGLAEDKVKILEEKMVALRAENVALRDKLKSIVEKIRKHSK